MTWKKLQDRYKWLRRRLDEQDRSEQQMSQIGGEVTEMEEVMLVMKEYRDDVSEAKNTKRVREEK